MSIGEKKRPSPEQREKLLEDEVERRHKAGLLNEAEDSERTDRMIRKSIRDHGA